MTDEAHRRGVRVAAHSTGLEGSINAVTGGVDTLEHGPHSPDRDLLDLMKANGTTLIPTLSVFEWASREGVAEGLPAWAADRATGWLPGRQAMICEAAAAGIPIAVGTDTGGPPRGGHNATEVIALARAGLGVANAIRSATAVGAIALGIEDEVGTVEVGKVADLVAWRHDPIAHPEVLLDSSEIRYIVQASIPLRSS